MLQLAWQFGRAVAALPALGLLLGCGSDSNSYEKTPPCSLCNVKSYVCVRPKGEGTYFDVTEFTSNGCRGSFALSTAELRCDNQLCEEGAPCSPITPTE